MNAPTHLHPHRAPLIALAVVGLSACAAGETAPAARTASVAAPEHGVRPAAIAAVQAEPAPQAAATKAMAASDSASQAPTQVAAPHKDPPPAVVDTPSVPETKPVPPDTEAVFGGDKVRTLTLVYNPADYASQQADLTLQLGTFGSANHTADPAKLPVPQPLIDACAGQSFGANCKGNVPGTTFDGMCAQCMGTPGLVCLPQGYKPGDMLPGQDTEPVVAGLGGTPAYVPVTVAIDGQQLTHVGIRYKGNQSLQGAWAAGLNKLPFRLDFNHYAADYPETKSQRLHGFAKLTLATGWGDGTMLRDVLASEVLRDRGIPAPRAAFYRINIDRGDGKPFYAGLYIAVEDPTDVLPARDLNAAKGNVYKPEGKAANWTSFDPASFGKKNNLKQDDYSDIQAAVEALHAKGDNAATWHAALEERLDVHGFLRWLAVNTAISNMDAYGHSAQNYYLVGVPGEYGRLHWVPWDHNMAFCETPPPVGKMPPKFSVYSDFNIMHDDTGYEWPLIRILLDDPEYRLLYKKELVLAVQGLYDGPAFAARVATLNALIQPHLYGPDGEQAPYTTLMPQQGAGSAPSAANLVQFAEQMRKAVLISAAN